MSLGDRIIERLAALNMSQAELARRVGITQPSINHLIKKGAGGSAHLHKIARALETTPEYLAGESDEISPLLARDDRRSFAGAEPENERLTPANKGQGSRSDSDLVDIDSLDFAFGMGGTFLDVGDPEVEKAQFGREWLRKNVSPAPPELLGVATGVGDSMEPVLHDRDLIFFDRSQRRLDDHFADKMWAFAYGQIGMVKRLRQLPDGRVRIMSANNSYSDEIAGDGEIHIIGRVVASMRRH